MADEDVLLTEVRDRTLVITLNRPHVRNALDRALGRALAAAIDRLDGDPNLSVGVLTGAGGTFSSGMDLKAFAHDGLPAAGDEGEVDRFFRAGSSKPLIAAVEGYALAGGLEVALACDLIVAASGAKLGIPEVTVGLFAAAGGLFRLARRLPHAVAVEMALTGDPITAETAYHHGLVVRLAEPGTAVDVAVELAARISRNAPLAVAASSEVIRRTYGHRDEEMWDVQSPMVERVFSSEDAKEGPRAFAEKRRPAWRGA